MDARCRVSLSSVAQWATCAAAVFQLILLALLSACGMDSELTGDEWRLAFLDRDAHRIAVCWLDGSHLHYITPDSLIAGRPSADSTGAIVIFAATRPDNPEGPSALYAVGSNGTGLELLTYVPFHINELVAGPDGSFALFVGRYADSDQPRVYRFRRGEPGFVTVLGPERTPFDLAMPPTGANFLFHDQSVGDTMWVGNVAGGLPIPIYNFPYSQCSFLPDGLGLVTVDRGAHNTLALFDFRDWTADTLVAPGRDSAVADPAVNPPGDRACFIRTPAAGGPARIAVVDLKLLHINTLPPIVKRPAGPVWVR